MVIRHRKMRAILVRPYAGPARKRGAILDAAALALAAVDGDWGPETGMCLHAGIVSLRHIADFHGIPYQGDAAVATIAVTEHEVIAACQELKAAGVTVVSDLDAVYDRFRASLVAYDHLLLALCAYFYAPPAPWSSDRAVAARPGRRSSTSGREASAGSIPLLPGHAAATR